MLKCFSCAHCINIYETRPFGTCLEKSKQVNVLRDGCIKHSQYEEVDNGKDKQSRDNEALQTN